jgi:hypothetical protein
MDAPKGYFRIKARISPKSEAKQIANNIRSAGHCARVLPDKKIRGIQYWAVWKRSKWWR